MITDHVTKENILSAAKTEFALHGFSGARLASIAENSGINKALIHYYFKSKDLLYEDVWKSFFEWDDDLNNVPIYFDNTPFTASEKLYLYIYVIVNLNIKFIDVQIVNLLLWELAEGGNFLRKFHDEYLEEGNRTFNLILEIGQKEGIFDLKYKDMINLCISSMNFIYKIEKSRDKQKQLYLEILYENRDEKFLDYIINYVFKMLSPADKPISVPEIKPEILEYIDKLLNMSSNKISIPISRRIMEYLCND